MRKIIIYLVLLSVVNLGFTQKEYNNINTIYSAREFVALNYPELDRLPFYLRNKGTADSNKWFIRINPNIVFRKALKKALNDVARKNGYKELKTNEELLAFTVFHEYGHIYAYLYKKHVPDTFLAMCRIINFACKVPDKKYRSRPNEAFADKFAFELMRKYNTIKGDK